MSKKKPQAVNRVPGVKSDLSVRALQAWQPEIKYVAAAGEQGAATISILEPIGQDFFGDGVTSKRIAAALRNIGERDVEVVINSPGGDVFEGLAIYGLLVDHPGAVTVKVLGLAASAASIIAMAGDRIEIMRSGFFMIHNAWVCACGDRNTLSEVADFLEPIDAALADIYEARTGGNLSEIRAMMDRETWMAGSQAIEAGFADALLGDDEVAQGDGDDASLSASGAKRKVEAMLTGSGLSRSEARALLSTLSNSGTPDAALVGTPDAAALSEVSGLLSDLQNFQI